MNGDNFRFIDLLVGILGVRIGIQNQGDRWVSSSEWDKDTAKTYE